MAGGNLESRGALLLATTLAPICYPQLFTSKHDGGCITVMPSTAYPWLRLCMLYYRVFTCIKLHLYWSE
ncbi:hypothetical protein GDO81_015457 [Engystomops pustulosus]|uniref:Secreted protein n=1 Tax=Engystomops pustulosus TaxID=76066 RepID=A0AAV7AKH7_ENGPU|nr:hypothetical protein GDO81_015457 [Engystomops pustulosus]